MDLIEFKSKYLREKLNITKEYGRIFSSVDFGNVNYWFENDDEDINGLKMQKDDKLIISIEKLSDFCKIFSSKVKFYFGLDYRRKKSFHLIKLARNYFGKTNAVTKNIQLIKHYLDEEEIEGNTRSVNYDKKGKYVYIPKCNFDVEICIDAIRLMDYFNTFCLFSSDADFISLLKFLKNKDKKIILIKGGPTQSSLKKQADLVISAQDIKGEIAIKKSDLSKMQKSRR